MKSTNNTLWPWCLKISLLPTVIFFLAQQIACGEGGKGGDCSEDDESGCGFYRMQCADLSSCGVSLSFSDPCGEIDDLETRAGDSVSIYTGDARSHFTIGAPHGGYDQHTEDVVRTIASTGIRWNWVIFEKFRNAGLRHNVNRPTLKIPSDEDDESVPDSSEEDWSFHSEAVYQCYVSKIQQVSDWSDLTLYVEIHGNDSGDELEIATGNIDSSQAVAIKEILNIAFASDFPRLNVKIQPLDSISATAGASKACGLFCQLNAAGIPYMHLELGRYYRGLDSSDAIRDNFATTLAGALAEIEESVSF